MGKSNVAQDVDYPLKEVAFLSHERQLMAKHITKLVTAAEPLGRPARAPWETRAA